MKTVGIIVEYNPFHYGHTFHLEKAREISNANVVIAVMSGNFLQRGEPALVSKWARTKMALAAGVDLVIELPYQFATQKADTFANGAISILNELGCEKVCFGSESGYVNEFNDTATFFLNNKTELDEQIKFEMTKGDSYPVAVAKAYNNLSSGKSLLDFSKPNNMLGFQYVLSIMNNNFNIEPITIKRRDANYHDKYLTTEKIASATSIRKAIFSNNEQLSYIKKYVPNPTYKSLTKYKQDYGSFHHWEHYWPYLQYNLIKSTEETLKNIYEMEEGLQNRLKDAAYTAKSFQHFMETIKTKRYTWTRLQRAAVHLLTNTTKQEMYAKSRQVNYLRLLGFNNAGRKYLNKIKHDLSVPLISRLAAIPAKETMLDVRSSQVYALNLRGRLRLQLMKDEYRHPPIYYKK